eukprot:TRINITY_DN41_c0_g1_i1.p2 TRINITY_DN41_c0_g1~~TRINITY_DN41_c0_g1_i1.p2  ORF type:complete len:103 (-),score=21.28 TRINITY_DN41_c0_g1_i1:18-326(-)
MAKKKGFMTPERKKKLRTLLRKKAAEELKKEQERKAEERLRVIAERCGTKPILTTLPQMSSRRSASNTSTSGTDLREKCSSFSARLSSVTSRSTSLPSLSVT